MATILNKLNNAVEFNKERHAVTVDERGRAKGARPFVDTALGGYAALRLIGRPDQAEWVLGGVNAVANHLSEDKL